MPTPYKLKLLNGVLKLKTFSDQVLSILGIKDLGTRTGNVTNGVVDWSIQHFTKTTAQWTADTTTILLDGQIGVENTGTTTYKFKIGNGVDLWSALGYAGGGSSSGVTSFNARTGVVVPASGDYTTAQLTVSTDKNFVTDAQLVVIGNTIGTNSGDNAANTTSNTYADGKVAQTITNGVTTSAPSQDVVFDALALKQNIVAGVDDTEIGYLNGVTSSIQTQLNSKGYVVASRYYATLNPADSTTYFTAYVFASNLTTTGAGTIHKALKSGTSINVGWTHTCTVGSNEGVTLKVTNKTTLVTITITTTIDMSSANVNNSYLAQALTYSAGDQLEVTIETPAWVTNPSGVRFNVDLHLV